MSDPMAPDTTARIATKIQRRSGAKGRAGAGSNTITRIPYLSARTPTNGMKLGPATGASSS
jgi:hypothetical protein